ncbi:cytochrome c oxidase subunit II [Halosimplex aquaticum]|uniref:cytochrome-c oxidase n=1 Tax=Halosimplex aquaticum TaxID=3026162 RepID=A0ABD5Y1V0_9EURY|nr:cytochrome c oxidase subunit II [Halosimplex aquaticum]
MKGKRVALLALFGAVLAAVAIEPAAAQAGADSTTEELIWDLNNQLLYIAVPITVLVEAILFYTVWKFKNNESPLPTKENRRLEITWTVATAVILLFVGVASYQVLAEPYVTATQDTVAENLGEDQAEVLNVQVTAQKYNWQFNYPESGVSNANTLVLPADRPVRLNVTSADWLHAFHAPGLGLKTDAFPGQSNYIFTKPTDTGEYQLYCAEYCGVGHSQMLGTVEVRSQEEFQSWLAENSGSGGSGGNATAGNATAGNGTAANETAALSP